MEEYGNDFEDEFDHEFDHDNNDDHKIKGHNKYNLNDNSSKSSTEKFRYLINKNQPGRL